MLPSPPPAVSGSPTADGTVTSHSLFQSVCRDVDEQASKLRDWQQHYEQLSAGSFSGTVTEVCFNGFQLFRETTHQQIHQTGAHRPGCESFAVPIALSGRARFAGRSLHCNDLMILREQDPLDFCAPQYCDVMALTVPVETLQQFAMQVADWEVERYLGCSGVRSHPSHSHSESETPIDRWRTFLLTVLNTICTTPHLLNHPNICHTLSQSLLWHLMTVLEELEGAIASPHSELSRQQIVGRAKTYLHEHIEEPITIADLCLALGVSRRTLQYSFQEVLDINPVRYLKAVRLNGVRRSLKQSTPQTTTVGDVAAQWGFWHLSRFAAEYRAMFGELPSATLHRVAQS